MNVAVLDVDLGASELPNFLSFAPQGGIADLVDRRIRRCLLGKEASQFFHAHLAQALIHWLWLTMTPDRGRPGRIAIMPGHDVEVELRHDVADRCGVDLVCAGVPFQPRPETGGKRHQALLISRAEVMQLAGASHFRDEHEPHIARVIGKSHLYAVYGCDKVGAAGDPAVEFECHVSP